MELVCCPAMSKAIIICAISWSGSGVPLRYVWPMRALIMSGSSFYRTRFSAILTVQNNAIGQPTMLVPSVLALMMLT